MCKSILGKLYYGEICPAEQIVLQSEQYKEALRQAGEFREQLANELPDSKLLEDYISARITVESNTLQATFIEGFRLGAKIILEITSGDIPDSRDISVSICGKNQQVIL